MYESEKEYNVGYDRFKLKDNPFRPALPLSPEDIIWLGTDRLKTQIEKRIMLAMRTSSSRVILNWGDYGNGKTYTAAYYSRTRRLKELSDKLSVSPAKSIKVCLPRTSKNIVQAFWRALLGQIRFDDIISGFKQLKKIFKDDFDKIVAANSDDNLIGQLFITVANESESQKTDDIKNYFYSDKTETMLKQSDVPPGISDDEQVVNLISTIFNCLTYKKKIYSAILLWIDEFENIDTVRKSDADRFAAFLKQLTDKSPNNLNIFLNFTPKKFLALEDLSVYLGEALLNRAKLKIRFDAPSADEAADYLRALLNHPSYRTEEKPENKFCPFSEELVTYILQHIGRLSIRKINEVFSIILEMALIEETKEITIDFVETIKEEIISWED
ncbi:hypothetical protein [Desulfonema magnum]|uniref:Uncharacterized protein n=1 Tax=Desulfonema magnum TaxID=45655 RepID=A0A975BR53_9BACT|nr:hypothetical protein [Desulfonema magnum]QTA89694.1 Uncharacterized protein dnm_057510 [Desulfonema magnum]